MGILLFSTLHLNTYVYTSQLIAEYAVLVPLRELIRPIEDSV